MSLLWSVFGAVDNVSDVRISSMPTYDFLFRSSCLPTTWVRDAELDVVIQEELACRVIAALEALRA